MHGWISNQRKDQLITSQQFWDILHLVCKQNSHIWRTAILSDYLLLRLNSNLRGIQESRTCNQCVTHHVQVLWILGVYT